VNSAPVPIRSRRAPATKYRDRHNELISVLGGRTQNNGLTDRHSADPGHGAVDSGAVLVRTNDRLHHFWRTTSRVGIDVDHRAALVAHGDGDRGCVAPLAEREHAAHPLVLLEGNGSHRTNDDVRAKSSHVRAHSCEMPDLTDRIERDHGDARLIEDPVLQLHHLHGSSVPTSDLGGQVRTEDIHLFAIRRAHVRGKVPPGTVLAAERSKQDEVGKLAGGEPRERAAVFHAPQGQAPVAIEAVPAQIGGVEAFAAHRFHGIPEDRFHLSDFHAHVCSSASQAASGRQKVFVSSSATRTIGRPPLEIATA